MSGVSGIFASMAELAKQYGLDKAVKKAGGAKGRVLASVLFQTQGASVSLAYNYGNNGRDMLKAGVSVGIEIFAGSVVTALIPASAPVLVFVGIAAIASVGISLFLNTQIGKNTIDLVVDKLQSFFSLFDSNPNRYELILNPNLESQDYQSLIELLLDTNSTAKDIDSLLHSFPHYLQDSKQPLKSNNTESNPTQSNTTTTTKTPKANTGSTDSKTLTPNNNNQTPNTFPFSLQIKDYNTFTPLSNKQIQITNIDSKQIYTQTTDSRGYVSFHIKEFRVEPVDDKIQNFLARFCFYCIAIFLCLSAPLLADSNSFILNPLKASSFEKSKECDITKKGNICEITFRIPLDLWRVWDKNNQHIDIGLYF